MGQSGTTRLANAAGIRTLENFQLFNVSLRINVTPEFLPLARCTSAMAEVHGASAQVMRGDLLSLLVQPLPTFVY